MLFKLRTMVICLAILLSACGEGKQLVHLDSEIKSYETIIIQINDDSWTLKIDEIPAKTATLLLNEKYRLLFLTKDDGHTLHIPEFGISLLGKVDHSSESWFKVSKAIEVVIHCENHPEEKTGLTLRFE